MNEIWTALFSPIATILYALSFFKSDVQYGFDKLDSED